MFQSVPSVQAHAVSRPLFRKMMSVVDLAGGGLRDYEQWHRRYDDRFPGMDALDCVRRASARSPSDLGAIDGDAMRRPPRQRCRRDALVRRAEQLDRELLALLGRVDHGAGRPGGNAELTKAVEVRPSACDDADLR